MVDVTTKAELAAVIEETLKDREAEYERTPAGDFVVMLPGTSKQKTLANLVIGDHALRVEAFIMRHPDENREQLYAWLLTRNARMYGVAFSIDAAGDVYLTGRLSLASITPDELDRILGSVLEYSDGSFKTMLEIGYPTAIRREWAWRVKRGESLANLEAFADWAGSDAGPETAPH